MNKFEYFPSNVYRDERPEWVELTSQVVSEYCREKKSEDILFQSNPLQHDTRLKFLVDYIISSSYNILREQGYDVDRYEIYLSALWVQDIDKGGGTNVHVHKNSQISGWFFLETPTKGSYPIYYDPRLNKQMIELDIKQHSEVMNSTSFIHFNNIIPGTILFNNAWLNHQLTQNFSQDRTRSIHFIVSHREMSCSTC